MTLLQKRDAERQRHGGAPPAGISVMFREYPCELEVQLALLSAELHRDCELATKACVIAAAHLDLTTCDAIESCGYQLVRVANVLEQLSVHIGRTFERDRYAEEDWRIEWARRLALAASGRRPAFLPSRLIYPLDQLCAFRRAFTHARDVHFDSSELRPLLNGAEIVTSELPRLITVFIEGVAAMHGLTVPSE